MTPALLLALMLTLPDPLADCAYRADAGLPECVEQTDTEPQQTEEEIS